MHTNLLFPPALACHINLLKNLFVVCKLRYLHLLLHTQPRSHLLLLYILHHHFAQQLFQVLVSPYILLSLLLTSGLKPFVVLRGSTQLLPALTSPKLPIFPSNLDLLLTWHPLKQLPAFSAQPLFLLALLLIPLAQIIH